MSVVQWKLCLYSIVCFYLDNVENGMFNYHFPLNMIWGLSDLYLKPKWKRKTKNTKKKIMNCYREFVCCKVTKWKS
jgi:hypothetical protein